MGSPKCILDVVCSVMQILLQDREPPSCRKMGRRPLPRGPSLRGDGRVARSCALAPAVNASADKYHLGHITKQGSTLLRFALGQAASHAARMDADLKRIYFTLVHRRGRPKAKVAVARKLLVRLFIMLRDQIDYDEFQRRGRPAPVSA